MAAHDAEDTQTDHAAALLRRVTAAGRGASPRRTDDRRRRADDQCPGDGAGNGGQRVCRAAPAGADRGAGSGFLADSGADAAGTRTRPGGAEAARCHAGRAAHRSGVADGRGVLSRRRRRKTRRLSRSGIIITIGQPIGLIEAMKVYSELPSEVAGRIVEIVAQNGKLVQQGQPILFVEPI